MKLLILSLLLLIAKPEKGVVKFYNESKGYGYIVSKGEEYYVYEEGLIDEINKGDRVVFDVRDTRKGLEAYNVRLNN